MKFLSPTNFTGFRVWHYFRQVLFVNRISSAISLFLIAEAVRVAKVPCLGELINQNIKFLVDKQDRGRFVCTHIFLLYGIGYLYPISRARNSMHAGNYIIE